MHHYMHEMHCLLPTAVSNAFQHRNSVLAVPFFVRNNAARLYSSETQARPVSLYFKNWMESAQESTTNMEVGQRRAPQLQNFPMAVSKEEWSLSSTWLPGTKGAESLSFPLLPIWLRKIALFPGYKFQGSVQGLLECLVGSPRFTDDGCVTFAILWMSSKC